MSERAEASGKETSAVLGMLFHRIVLVLMIFENSLKLLGYTMFQVTKFK